MKNCRSVNVSEENGEKHIPDRSGMYPDRNKLTCKGGNDIMTLWTCNVVRIGLKSLVTTVAVPVAYVFVCV